MNQTSVVDATFGSASLSMPGTASELCRTDDDSATTLFGNSRGGRCHIAFDLTGLFVAQEHSVVIYKKHRSASKIIEPAVWLSIGSH